MGDWGLFLPWRVVQAWDRSQSIVGSLSLGVSKLWNDKARAALIQCCRQSYSNQDVRQETSRAPFHQQFGDSEFHWL